MGSLFNNNGYGSWLIILILIIILFGAGNNDCGCPSCGCSGCGC